MRFLCRVLIFMIVFTTPLSLQAFLPITSPSVVLMDQATGAVLYAKNQHIQQYPAGLTKMLSALVAVDYLDPEQVVVVGSEIYTIPPGALMAGHQVGEHITVHNLLRGLMIQNGNDSGAVIALQTVMAERRRGNIPFVDAERVFASMMNRRAYELGARNSNFENPNGLHHDRHFTTAYDMALIARAFMDHPLLREIAGEVEFYGNSLGDLYIEGARTVDHHWVDNNQLMSGGTFHFPYATGIRSGSTPQAADCLAASAERRGVRLIAIVLNSEDPARWQDARMLFDYGFSTYEYHEVLEAGQLMETVIIANAMLGMSDLLDVASAEGFTKLLSQDQIARLQRDVIFDDFFLAYNYVDYYGNTILKAPIQENDVLGRVVYSLDGNILFEGELWATATVEERSLDSDMDFYIALIRDNIFTIRALPFWMGAAGIFIGVAGVSLAIAERRRSKRSWYGRR